MPNSSIAYCLDRTQCGFFDKNSLEARPYFPKLFSSSQLLFNHWEFCHIARLTSELQIWQCPRCGWRPWCRYASHLHLPEAWAPAFFAYTPQGIGGTWPSWPRTTHWSGLRSRAWWRAHAPKTVEGAGGSMSIGDRSKSHCGESWVL